MWHPPALLIRKLTALTLPARPFGKNCLLQSLLSKHYAQYTLVFCHKCQMLRQSHTPLCDHPHNIWCVQRTNSAARKLVRARVRVCACVCVCVTSKRLLFWPRSFTWPNISSPAARLLISLLQAGSWSSACIKARHRHTPSTEPVALKVWSAGTATSSLSFCQTHHRNFVSGVPECRQAAFNSLYVTLS
jgi:hypothetical protein